MYGMENTELIYFVAFFKHTKEIPTKYLKLCHDFRMAFYSIDKDASRVLIITLLKLKGDTQSHTQTQPQTHGFE